MAARHYSLEPLCVFDAGGGAELVRLGARTGYDFVSMFAHVPNSQLPLDPAVNDSTARKEMKAALAETGVRLLNLECFNLDADCDPASFAAALECGGDLGAATATAIVWENPDLGDALAKFQRLCDMAAEHDIKVNVEFFAAARSLPTIVEVAEFVRGAGRTNAGIVIDVLHLMRTSGGLEGLRSIDPEWIGAIQLCDGMLEPPADLGAEMVARLLPGAGQFPLRDIVAYCPGDLPLGIEAADFSQMGTVTPEARAAAMRRAAGAIFD